MSCTIAIPAYQPGEEMLPYIADLLRADIGPVVVVDDGSGTEYEGIFTKAEALPGCTVLRHPENRGKGAAIKTALAHYKAHTGGSCGLVTADCDGQHTVPDVAEVCHALSKAQDSLVLGTREFGPETPKRSATGNRVMSGVMRVLYDINLPDTQTGLRGIPNFMVDGLQKIKGERYDYELNMLLYAKQRCIPFTLVPIETVYFNNNEGSHYRTVADSVHLVARMGSGLTQYGFSSALAGVVDLFLYSLLVKIVLVDFPLGQKLFWAAFTARMVSSVVNYACNRQLPYVQNKKLYPTALRYYILWCGQLAVSFGAVWLLHTAFGFDEVFIKIAVDALLGLLSYQVQLRWVFKQQGAVESRVFQREEV